MYTKIEYHTKTIETKIYKQLSKQSREQVVKDIKQYCDRELLVMYEPNKLSNKLIPVPQTIIHNLVNMFIEETQLLILEPKYTVLQKESKRGSKLRYYWHTRWENDYEGTYSMWSDNLILIISSYIDKHENEYQWEITKTIETVLDNDEDED